MPKRPLGLKTGVLLAVFQAVAVAQAVPAVLARIPQSSMAHSLALTGLLVGMLLVGGACTWWSGGYDDPERRLGVGTAFAMLGMLGFLVGLSAALHP